MFNSLLLHDTTRAQLATLAVQPPHGLLILGVDGIGKLSIARALAQQVASRPASIQLVEPDERGTITIEAVRDLYKTTRGKQQGYSVVVIDHADQMSTEAENAFLKLLEEPRDGLCFILTAPRQESLLPTILSRLQQITLSSLPDEAIRRAIVAKKPGIAAEELSQIVFLAQGRPATAFSLLTAEAFKHRKESMQLAKQLIAAQPYTRYGLIATLAADRDSCIASLEAMMRIAEVQLAANKNRSQLAHWLALANALEDALQAITHNGNLRAHLLKLLSSY